MFKRWVIHNLLKTFTFEVKGVVHIRLPEKKIKINYNNNKNKRRPDGSLFKLSRTQKPTKIGIKPRT
jgi:hypothetical protein